MGVNIQDQQGNKKSTFPWPRTSKGKHHQASKEEPPREVVAIKKKLNACDATGNESNMEDFLKHLG